MRTALAPGIPRRRSISVQVAALAQVYFRKGTDVLECGGKRQRDTAFDFKAAPSCQSGVALSLATALQNAPDLPQAAAGERDQPDRNFYGSPTVGLVTTAAVLMTARVSTSFPSVFVSEAMPR